MKNMDINKCGVSLTSGQLRAWIEHTQRAVKQTGKTFSEIPKTSIIEFLKESGIGDRNLRETIYDELSKINSVKKPITNGSENKPRPFGPQGPSYMENDSTPKKEPRKSVFGEIKRVA